MMHNVVLLVVSLIICLLTSCGSPGVSRVQPVSVRAVAPEVVMKHDFYTSDDSLRLLLKFEDSQDIMDVLQSATALEYFVKSGYGGRDPILTQDSLVTPARRLSDKEGKLFMSFSLPKHLVTKPNVIHLRLWHALVGQERMAVKFTIPLEQEMLGKNYMLVKAESGMPLFTEYINTSEKLVVQRFGSYESQMQVNYFDDKFQPALPPMSSRKEEVPQNPTATESLLIETNDTIHFKNEGFYLFEPNSGFPRGVLVKNWAYPQITMAKEMIDPLIYLTTSAEREELYSAKDAKKAVDNFWLKVGGTSADARDLIRKFYGRVEAANQLFSCYKPGWATDQGMIYIIYGKPNNVSHAGNTITWIYRDSETSPYVKFVFNKKANNFTKNHYELVRLREYEDSWYNTVAKWRAGITKI